ncbi:TetR/AcrR family transcriptional regulator [Arthrobacter sp. A5]|uniref:TetR/AcrR family transcriptional regulator n=1 Tax=Arthrobacter sp. A5 TaxID=576926 RepID=UPI003DA8A966
MKQGARPRAKSADERRRHPTEVRRRLVIESGRDLIADKGLFNVQIRDISRACGVSPGTITYHFRSLEEVLWEVVKAETMEFYEPLREAVSNSETNKSTKLLDFLRGMFRSDSDTRRHWLIWMDFWSAAARDDAYGEWMNTHYEAWWHALRDLIEAGVEGGEFTCPDSQGFAVSVSSIVDGLAIQCYSRKARISVDQAREHLLHHVRDGLGIVESAK